MARKTLLAGGKDLTHKPRGALFFQRAPQLGQLACDDRQDIPFEVAALGEEGAERLDAGIGVKRARGHMLEAAAEVLYGAR
jgi:hypothetical protein